MVIMLENMLKRKMQTNNEQQIHTLFPCHIVECEFVNFFTIVK